MVENKVIFIYGLVNVIMEDVIDLGIRYVSNVYMVNVIEINELVVIVMHDEVNTIKNVSKVRVEVMKDHSIV